MSVARYFNRSAFLGLLGSLLLLAFCVAPASADHLDDAKLKGWVGEQRNGYLGIAHNTDGERTVKLVERVNESRRKRYEEIASRNGTTLQSVEQLAGAKLIERAKPGEYVQGADGRWVRK